MSEHVLIVGAGPTGLVAAAELGRRGVPVEVLETRPEPVPHRSKAIIFWPPSVRALRAAGVDPIALGAQRIRAFDYHLADGRHRRVPFTASTGPVTIEQPVIERALEAVLREPASNVMIRRGVTVDSFTQHACGVCAVDTAGTRYTANWLIAADGAHGRSRRLLGDRSEETGYSSDLFIVETRIPERTDHDVVHYVQGPGGFLMVAPLPGGWFRLGGSVPAVGWSLATVAETYEQLLGSALPLAEVRWQSTFPVARRTATSTRKGRCFLIGDAAHTVSPANGQGVNVGIQDAQNLGWKLALVATGRADRALLDSYEPERRAAAALAERQTDWQTRAWLLRGRFRPRLRDLAITLADRGGLLRRWYAPLLAQQRVRYPGPARSRECVPTTAWPRWGTTGRRLADLEPLEPLDDLTLLVTDHQLLDALRGVNVPLRTGCPGPLPCRRPGFYLVRPDGFVALHGHRDDIPALLKALPRPAR